MFPNVHELIEFGVIVQKDELRKILDDFSSAVISFEKCSFQFQKFLHTEKCLGCWFFHEFYIFFWLSNLLFLRRLQSSKNRQGWTVVQ